MKLPPLRKQKMAWPERVALRFAIVVFILWASFFMSLWVSGGWAGHTLQFLFQAHYPGRFMMKWLLIIEPGIVIPVWGLLRGIEFVRAKWHLRKAQP